MENKQIQESRMDDVEKVSFTPTTLQSNPEQNELLSPIKSNKPHQPQSPSTQQGLYSDEKSNLIQDEGSEAVSGEISSVEKNINNENKMRQVEIEKMVLNCGATEDKLERCVKLLEMIAEGRKIYKIKATKRIPAFGISPGKLAGCKVTIRDKEKIKDLLKRFFAARDNGVKEKQITENQLSFGIHEYIEVPGLEYSRDIGILGFEVMLVFKRKGKRVKLRKVKRGSYPKKQAVSREEIIEYLIKNFGLEVN